MNTSEGVGLSNVKGTKSSQTRMSRYVINSMARFGPSHSGLFGSEEYRSVETFFLSQECLHPTPLRSLGMLASALGIGGILLKDESARFGLNSFKSLGVSYSIHRLLSEGRLPTGSVLVCATEGNHGRAVARAARANNLGAKIYVAANTSKSRIEAVESEGASVIVVDGNYDDAVKQATRDADHYGWQVISDTSWHGYDEIPRWIMAGYTRLLMEAESQWSPDPPPDVVFVQAGVGGLSCAVVSWLCYRYGAQRPFSMVCEPTTATCFLESARSGEPVSLRGPFDTILAGLRCGEVSPVAWPTFAADVDAFVSIDDEQCAQVMRTLAYPLNGDPVVVAGASGACGLASLVAVLQDESLRPVRDASGLSARSRVFVINTEGATDPELYSRITGKDAATIAPAKS